MLDLNKPLKFSVYSTFYLNLKLNVEFDLMKHLIAFQNIRYQTQQSQFQ